MKIQELYTLFLRHPAITTDSRDVADNSLFFALKGENFNGNEFADEALRKGCKYAVVDDPSCVTGKRFLLVADVLTALQELAAFHRIKFTIPVVGITGTNGKTTTKELISRVLGKRYTVAATRGNLNNHIGVPVTLLSITGETNMAVVEMGANHLGEIRHLCNIAQPTHGLITNIGVAHLEGFGSVENIRKAKSELYDFLTDNHGTIFYNEQNNDILQLLRGRKVNLVPYRDSRLSEEAVGEEARSGPFTTLCLKTGKEKIRVKTQLAGDYNAENILAAIRTGLFFGVKMKEVIHAIESYRPENNRSQTVVTSRNRICLDAYNANPTSMRVAISGFVRHHGTSGLLILGDMLELGEDSVPEHTSLIQFLEQLELEKVFLVGPLLSGVNQNPEFHPFRNVDDLVGYLKGNPVESMDIFIKGSRKMQLEKAIPFL